jgi:S1-C subfamily serine protease
VVKVTSGAAQVSGVVLASPANHVLTTSVSLGAGPLVGVQADNGQTFVGWIVGRDDAKNLALVKVKNANLPGVPFGDSLSVKVGGEVLLVSYPVARPEGFAASGLVTGIRTDFSTGSRFIRLDIPALLGASGGPVFNRTGELLAILVEPSYIVSLGFAASDEAYTKAEDSIRPAMAALAGGAVSLTAPRPTPTPNPASPPPLPVIVKGKATAGGLPAPAGLTLYARLFGPGLLEQWYFAAIGGEGAYVLTIGVNNAVYTSGKIEFYLDGVKSGATINYQAGEVLEVDLSFP